MDVENENNNGGQKRRRRRHEIMRDALQARDQNTPESSKKTTAFSDSYEVKDQLHFSRKLNSIKRSVSFSDKSEARNFNSKDPAVELGEIIFLSTKTKTPPLRRVGLPAPSHSLYVPSLEETILEDDIAFSFLDNEECVANSNLQERYEVNKENVSEASVSAAEQHVDSFAGESADAYQPTSSSNSKNIPEVIGEAQQEASQFGVNSNSVQSGALDPTGHVAGILLILQHGKRELARKSDGHSKSAKGIHALSHADQDQVDGYITETEVEDDDSDFSVDAEQYAANVSNVRASDISTEIEEDDDVGTSEMNSRLVPCSTTEEESFEEYDGLSLQRDLTKSTLLLSDEATEPGNDAPPTLMSIVPPEMFGELNVACDLLHLVTSENVVSITNHVKATVCLMTLDIDRYVPRKTLMKESGIETLMKTPLNENNGDDVPAPVAKVDRGENTLWENANPSVISMPDLASITKTEETPPTHRGDTVLNEQNEIASMPHEGGLIIQDDIPFVINAEAEVESANKAVTEDSERIQKSFVVATEEENTLRELSHRFPREILRAETYEAPPSVIQQPSIDIAKLIHICTISATSNLDRERATIQKANKSKRLRQYPVHSLAENTPIGRSPIDTLIGGKVYKKSRS